jgi:acyl-CoA dehydrogenase
MKAADTSELFFDNVPVPPENILGGAEGRGFYQMMQQLPQERLIIGCGAVGAIEGAVALTIQYCKEREAFGKPIIDFQNTRFKLAECKTNALVARSLSGHLHHGASEGRTDRRNGGDVQILADRPAMCGD